MLAECPLHGPTTEETRAMSAVLDPDVVRRLGEELRDDRAAARVAAGFLSLLPERTRRLHQAVSGQHADDALERVLSLKVTASMVGARSLQLQAERLELLVRGERWLETPLVLVALRREVAPLTRELSALVAEMRGR
jgi:HPt (histidine-containing phosphotransfer) domain-containing protein